MTRSYVPVRAAMASAGRDRDTLHRRGQAIHDARLLHERGDSEGRRKAQTLLAQADRYDSLLDDHARHQGRWGHALAVDGGRILWGGRPLVLPPSGPTSERLGRHYSANFSNFIRGVDRASLVLGPDKLGLQAADDSRGGYLAPVEWTAMMAGRLADTVSVRRMATVIPLAAGATLQAASWDTDFASTPWSAEVPASDISEDSAARYGARKLIPHLMARLVKLSGALVRGAAISIDDHIGERLANRFGVNEEQAFVDGSGAGQPLGVYTASDDGVPTTQDTVCASATAFTGDELLTCLFSLREVYIRAATWLVHRGFIRRARLLKDGNGQYLWTEGLGGAADLLAGRPYELSEHCPDTYSTGRYVACVGDFQHYWIADSLDVSVQRLDEHFARTSEIGYLGTKETDGMPVTGEAFARLKLG